MTDTPATHVPASPTTRSRRLDALPFTTEHRRLVVGSGAGWALDAMDVGLISFVMASLAVQWGLSDTQLSWIASTGFVGMALGASLGGLLADRVGRRQVFALTLLVYGVATGASALSWSVGVLLATRFVVGLGLGAELPVASTLVSEFAPARIRGRVVVVLEAFWAVGWLLAALIGFLVIPLSDDGWRWALALGAAPAVYSVVVRRTLPESVRFLEGVGRHDEAEATVRRFEAAAGLAPGGTVTASPAGPAPAATHTETGRGTAAPRLWSRALRRRTASLWVVWFGVSFAYYGAFIWLPSLLHASGFSLVRSFGYTLVITAAQLPGYAVAAVLIERWGRRPTLGTFLVGSAASAVAFGTADSTVAVIGAGMALSFFNLGAWGALYAVTPEIYPTSIRGRGAGSAAAFGRIASIVAPLCVPLLRDAGGTPAVFFTFAAAFGVAALGVLGVPDLQGRPLDE